MKTRMQLIGDALRAAGIRPRKQIDRVLSLGDPCCFCGAKIERGIPYKKQFGKTFVSQHLMRYPQSPVMCEDCYLTFAEFYFPGDSREGRGKKMYVVSHLIDKNGWQKLTKKAEDKAIMLAALINPEPGWQIISVSFTGQQHTLFKAPISQGSNPFCRIRLDKSFLTFNRMELKELQERCQGLRNNGHRVDTILACEPSHIMLTKHPEDVHEFVQLEPYKNSKLLELAINLTWKVEVKDGTKNS